MSLPARVSQSLPAWSAASGGTATPGGGAELSALERRRSARAWSGGCSAPVRRAPRDSNCWDERSAHRRRAWARGRVARCAPSSRRLLSGSGHHDGRSRRWPRGTGRPSARVVCFAGACCQGGRSSLVSRSRALLSRRRPAARPRNGGRTGCLAGRPRTLPGSTTGWRDRPDRRGVSPPKDPWSRRGTAGPARPAVGCVPPSGWPGGRSPVRAGQSRRARLVRRIRCPRVRAPSRSPPVGP
jgi:hypothetical protein